MYRLPVDCLDEIFEHLEEDKINLRSCLLVNCLWCEVSVRILWRRIRNFNTLIACLPDESKEILSKNGIIISTSKSPMFSYASFCKVLSVYQVSSGIKKLLKNQQFISPQDLNDNLSVVTQEIFKFLTTQISLRELQFYSTTELLQTQNLAFPVTSDCLKNLSELYCNSDVDPEFFYQLSQICRNIQSLNIEFKKVISNGLADLISVQQN